ncbi:MAG: ATPase, T2SS/T4P/T4SS family [Lachnospiraceae bacterium]|nr:ATPase, T2SS/T4P/T4SS family [Lachnospiraceae bacterium]
MAEETTKVVITPEFFGPLYQYIEDDSITDIDFDGRRLWLSNTSNERYSPETELPEDFVAAFTKRVANCVSKQFHKQSPVLEAETDTLRITIVHESAAISGRAICIRKSMPFTRLTREGMTRDGYLTDEMINLLINCVRAKMNMVFCGEPGVGKTECAKFFSQYIPKSERVITIEDNPEWHYAALNPGSDSVELRINPVMDYTKAIKTCLRLNPKWMMLSEARSKEVVYLMEGFSTGVRGMTTLHTDDVRKVPDRMLNMAGNLRSEGRLENDIYSFIDVAVLIRKKLVTRSDGSCGLMRYVDQVGFFYRRGRDNKCLLILDGGELTDACFPDEVKKKFEEANIDDPYVYTEPDQEQIRKFTSYHAPSMPAASGMVAEKKAVSYGRECNDMDRKFQEKMRRGMTFIGKAGSRG